MIFHPKRLIKEGKNEGPEESRAIFHLNGPERGLNAVNGHSFPYELRINELAYRNREKTFEKGAGKPVANTLPAPFAVTRIEQ